MREIDVAFAVRPGEHACSRCERPEDRERLAVALARAGIARGHKVVYLCGRSEASATVAHLCAADDAAGQALGSGQLEVRDAEAVYAPDGVFDADRMLAAVEREEARALAEGFTGLSLIGDVGAGVEGVAGAERLAEYERRLDAGRGETLVLLCQYDHRRFDGGTLCDVAAEHRVDVSPELAALGRSGALAAARVHRPETLRLAGTLDFEAAGAVAEVLGAHFPGALRVDLEDLRYVDVSGMRALRERPGEELTIAAASEAVRRLVELLGWDTDPAVVIGS
ncbi:MAG: hypothetical protein QOJ21_410 [Solirubrobacteraceae bacterium]|jgi:ABC-type transporter Mla MlaB component|nr:hypothetical protein [Solirubrobacteraceae bacterium]